MALLINCNDSKEKVVFAKDKNTAKDATLSYLGTHDNYQDKTKYLSVFYHYYNKKILRNDYKNATKAIDSVSETMVFNYDFTSPFYSTIKVFDSLYRKKQPELKTTFVDTYLGNYYFDKGDFKKSCDYFIKICELEPDDYNSCKKIARAYYELSYVYGCIGKQNLSLEANHKAALYFESINNLTGMATVYANYVNIYRAIRDKKNAYLNCNKAIDCCIKTKNQYDKYMGLYNKICIYDDFADPKTSKLIDSVRLDFAKSTYKSDILNMAFSNYKALYLLREDKIKEAKKLLDELKPLVTSINSEIWKQDYESAVAQYEVMSDAKNLDIKAIQSKIGILKDNKQFQNLASFLNVLKKYSVAKNDYKNALFYEEEIKKANDSMGSNIVKEKIIEVETKYQTQKKQQQIQLQDKTIDNNRSTIAALILTLLSLLLIGIIYLYQQKQKKMKQRQIVAEEFTKQLLEKMEDERKRIASDLHDSVNHELLVLRNSFNTKTDLIDAKIESIMNDVRNISRNLYPILFSKIGLVASIKQMIKRLQNDNDFLVVADLQYTKSLSTSNELQLYRIIQEVLSNTIKHSQALAAKITILSTSDNTFIELRDNGIGFNVPNVLTAETAFGLHNIIERSKLIGGIATITSDKEGTVVTINIKK